jgi:2-keto-4-pentenoate hydratase/2-oxohepta-3-ene-1,7-dioic acid hydratase in catechol pathway
MHRALSGKMHRIGLLRVVQYIWMGFARQSPQRGSGYNAENFIQEIPMRVASFRHQGTAGWGIVEQDQVRVAGPGYPGSVQQLLDEPTIVTEVLTRLRDEPNARRLPLADVELLAPIPRPRKNVICLGLNYVEHARESLAAKGQAIELPEHPVVFTKSVTAVTGPFADIPLPSRVTQQLDWEAELAVVIGKGGRFIRESDALSHVFGYTVVNDLSARDLQARHKQFFLGKSLDASCPMGPWLVTADEIADPQNLDVRCWVNGVVKQDSNTRHQQFTVARTIALLSEIMTLEPGDIISTGTPEGVGFARKPPEFLAPGDVVECEVAGVGRIRNLIVEA